MHFIAYSTTYKYFKCKRSIYSQVFVSDFIKVIDKALLTKKLHNNIYASREKIVRKIQYYGHGNFIHRLL